MSNAPYSPENIPIAIMAPVQPAWSIALHVDLIRLLHLSFQYMKPILSLLHLHFTGLHDPLHGPTVSILDRWRRSVMKVFIASGLVVAVVAITRLNGLNDEPTRLIGATERVTEVSTGLIFDARIDTGASCTSIHCDDLEFDNPAANPQENVGKRVRFLTGNGKRSLWLESVIIDYVSVRNSEHVEYRYIVPLTIHCAGMQKTVRVTLNDRTAMRYPFLIGRNFLRGDFIVDVNHLAAN
jgi:hypothetical protein